MTAPKTRPTRVNVASFLGGIKDPERRRDARTVAAMMRKATGAKATMWGPSIVGFGSHPIVGANGRSTDWPVAAFSPRSTALVLYFDPEFLANHPLRSRLGPHTTGKGCLYIKHLADVNLAALERMVRDAVTDDTD